MLAQIPVAQPERATTVPITTAPSLVEKNSVVMPVMTSRFLAVARRSQAPVSMGTGSRSRGSTRPASPPPPPPASTSQPSGGDSSCGVSSGTDTRRYTGWWSELAMVGIEWYLWTTMSAAAPSPPPARPCLAQGGHLVAAGLEALPVDGVGGPVGAQVLDLVGRGEAHLGLFEAVQRAAPAPLARELVPLEEGAEVVRVQRRERRQRRRPVRVDPVVQVPGHEQVRARLEDAGVVQPPRVVGGYRVGPLLAREESGALVLGRQGDVLAAVGVFGDDDDAAERLCIDDSMTFLMLGSVVWNSSGSISFGFSNVHEDYELYSMAARCVATKVSSVVRRSAGAPAAVEGSPPASPSPPSPPAAVPASEYVTLRATAPLLPMLAIPKAHSAVWMWCIASGFRAKSRMAVMPTFRASTSL
ncbi:hypothetical protein VSDG_06014 [Cytospora chrysosperma]|uniref:Uncharacterized protein n=1 Tax=Cytospora chrysosperma TaxID=252740 RepID=A0A423VWI6_CYTCH|nr:hypothetical protein VSDG_06014 [Valsa sordida]